jgi:hypothetical protein
MVGSASFEYFFNDHGASFNRSSCEVVMAKSLKPQHLKRYTDIVWPFARYGLGNILKDAGLPEEPDDRVPVVVSAKARTFVCLIFCLAGPFTAGPSTDLLRERDLAARFVLVAPTPIPSRPSAVDAHLEEERGLAEARQRGDERLRLMSFFEAIAGNDRDSLCKMLNEGMDPNAELPVPVPVAFQKRFTDERLRYYVASEKGFTALMLATALGNHSFVKILLSAGADPWKLTKRHKTYALWLAGKYL